MNYPQYCCAILLLNQQTPVTVIGCIEPKQTQQGSTEKDKELLVSGSNKSSHFLMQLRPEWSHHAPNKLVCFGGKREDNELPETCIWRELQEELSWSPEDLTLAVQLWVGSCLKAWFYVGYMDVDTTELQTEPGFEAHAISMDSLDIHPVSDWHRDVLHAYLRGEKLVQL